MPVRRRRLLGMQVLQAGGDILELVDSIRKLPPQVCLPCRQHFRITQDMLQGDFFTLYLMPQPYEGREGHRGSVEGPAGALLRAFNTTPEGLFFGTVEQCKLAHITKIASDQVVKILFQLVRRLFKVGVESKRHILWRPPPSRLVPKRHGTMVLCKHSPPMSFWSTHSHDARPSRVWILSVHCHNALYPMSDFSANFMPESGGVSLHLSAL